jgi:hypothetical protein
MKYLPLDNPENKAELIRIIDLVTDHRLEESKKKFPDGHMGREGSYVRDLLHKPYLMMQKILKERLDNNTVIERNLESTLLYYEQHLLKEDKGGRIKEVVATRNIFNVIHFTQTKNLDDILKNGIVSRKKLFEGGKNFIFNDNLRLDGKMDYSCFSIEFPNVEMLRALRYRTNEASWAILVFSSEILYDYDCLFYYTNSASNEVRHKDTIEFEGASALDKLFTWRHEERHHYLCDNDPTDVQSEVMVKDDVSIDYLRFCAINDESDFLRFQAAYPNIDFQYASDRTGLFNTRKAYSYGY